MALTQVIGSGIGQVTDIKLGGSGAANTLDDYEEGTWTPTAGTDFGTFTNATGTYTKIGQVVYINCYFTYSGASTSATNRLVTGLPFTVKNVHTTTSIDGFCLTWSNHFGFAYFNGNSTTIFDNSGGVLKNSFIAASNMRMSGFYFTDS